MLQGAKIARPKLQIMIRKINVKPHGTGDTQVNVKIIKHKTGYYGIFSLCSNKFIDELYDTKNIALCAAINKGYVVK